MKEESQKDGGSEGVAQCLSSSPPGLWYKSQFLREARVNLVSDEVCRHEDYYGNLITDNMFCAGRPDWSQDACEVFTTSQDATRFFGFARRFVD